LLRPRHHRPRHHRAAETGDEFPPFDHWITSSAVANSVSGMVRPSALAVLAFKNNSRGPRKIATSAELCESELWQQDSQGGTMGQFGFFDADRRLAAITAKGDPLEMIARVVPFESFRAEIEAAVLTPVSEKKSPAGRKPIDVMVMFR